MKSYAFVCGVRLARDRIDTDCPKRRNVLLETIPASAEISKYIDLLNINDTCVYLSLLSAIDQNFLYQFIPLIIQQHCIAGSIVTRSKRVDEMLRFNANNMEVIMIAVACFC